MIQGMHAMFRSSKPEELRAFIRDKLRLPNTDVGGGWLIFDLPEADIGVHPTEPGDESRSGEHDVSFFTSDVEATVHELEGRGVAFDQEVEDHGYGFVTYFTMPGNVRVQLYQPKYRKNPIPKPKAASGASSPAKKAKSNATKKRRPTAKPVKTKAKPRRRRKPGGA